MQSVRLGVAYYPESWPAEDWPRDIEWMKKAGIDVVRLAEFAWSHMEIEEGRFDFDWLEEFVELAGRSGIQSILCTPTEAPPPWLTANYPDTLSVDEKGLPRGAGGRRHYCVNNPAFLARSDSITQAMAKRFGNNPHVAGWQLDNEAGCHDAVRCYCEHCQREFRAWLEAKYSSPDALNRAWFSAFWSHEVQTFDHVFLHTNTRTSTSPQQVLDHKKFGGESWIRFLNRQTDILRAHAPNQFVTHNITWYQEEIDMHRLTEKLDFVGIDLYQREPYKMSMIDALFGSIKKGKKHWVMEMPAGISDGLNRLERPMPPEKLRSYFFRHYLRGAAGCSMWHFRRHLGGQEMFLGACLDHDGKPCWAFEGIVQVGEFIRRHGRLLLENRPVHDAAILFSYDDLFAAIQHAEHLGMDPWRVLDEVVPLYESLERRGLGVTFARPQDDLSAFAAVFAPLTFVSTHAVADNLRRYVHDGGTLIAYNRTGHFDEFGKAQPQSLPAYMQDVFGATIGRVDEVPPGESIRAAISGVKNKTTLSCNRAQELVPTTARTLAKFTSSRIKGAAALTCNALGNGKAMLVGILKPDAPTHQKVTDIVLAQTKLPWQPPGNGDIECIRGDKLTGYINLREDKSVVLNLPRAQNELVSGRKVRRITLEAYGVAVFTNDK